MTVYSLKPPLIANVEFEVSFQTSQNFDVWRTRRGIFALSTASTPFGNYIHARGTRRGLQALARELFDVPGPRISLRTAYQLIENEEFRRAEIEYV